MIWWEQRQSNQKWQTAFKRSFSSIKQAACLCQLWVWKKTIQLKRPCMFTHTRARTHTRASMHTHTHTSHAHTHVRTHIHMQLKHGASCILFCVMQAMLLFLFSTSVTEQPITNYTDAGTRLFSNLLVTSCKEDGGASQNQTHQSTSKVETKLIYWQTQNWGAAGQMWDILPTYCFKIGRIQIGS